jgi:hypothetical protein
MESTIASFSENPSQAAFKIAAPQYASVDASRLADLQNKITSRAARRNGGLSEGEHRSTELAKFLESSGANIDKVKELRDQLEKLRDRSDALIRKHLRPPISYQQQRNQSSSASEVLHARRKKLGDRTEAYMTRLLNPGKPKDVLEKARNAPISQVLKQMPVDLRLSQASDTLLSSDDESTIAKDQLLKGPRLPADFVHALDQVRFPNSKSDQAITSHKLACIALDRSRRWWSVYDPELGKSADLREIAPAPDGWPDLIQSSSPQGGEPGHKAFSTLGYLPPKLKDSVPRITPHIHAQDLMSNVLDKPETSGVAPVIASIYSFESGPDAKRIMPIQVVSSKDASDWWISAACASYPFFSHVSTGTNSTTKPSYMFGGALLDSNLESNRSDMSLESAMKNLGVIDAWSTAAAYIDPTAVQQEARASSAAAAAALISSDLNEANVATESSSSSAIATQSIEDLLSLSFELQAAPPFDFYGTSHNTQTLTSGVGSISTDTGIPSRTNLATPSLAAPGESVSCRVTSLFEALKRRLETEDGGNISGPDGSPISTSQLARNVAARTIQHFIRGRKFVQSAKRILAQKRENSAVFAKQKLNVIQTAMAQFIEALQSAGVVTGDDETAMNIAETARRAITSSSGIASTPSKQNLTSSHLLSSSKIPIIKRPGSAPDTTTGAPLVQPYLRYQRPVTSSGRK